MEEVLERQQEIERKSEILERDEIQLIWEDFLDFYKEHQDLKMIIDARVESLLDLKGEESKQAKLRALLTVYGIYKEDEARKKMGEQGSRGTMLMATIGNFDVIDDPKITAAVYLDGKVLFGRHYLTRSVDNAWFSRLFSDEKKRFGKKTAVNQVEMIQCILTGIEEFSHPMDFSLHESKVGNMKAQALKVANEAARQKGRPLFVTYYSSELEYLGLLAQQRYLKKWLPSSMGRVSKFVQEVGEKRSLRLESEAINKSLL